MMQPLQFTRAKCAKIAHGPRQTWSLARLRPVTRAEPCEGTKEGPRANRALEPNQASPTNA
eukprot:4937645-Alexandrium_andersonii.AAC.1